jgi:hypothetical protein
VFTAQFEDKGDTWDWFGTNESLLCHNKNWWCF